jgi:hypothetical protein
MRLCFPFLLLAACDGLGGAVPAGDDPSPGGDYQPGERCASDTGCVATGWWTGGFTTDGDGGFTSGTFGWEFYARGKLEPICAAGGELAYVGEAPAGCPDCTWSWDLSGLEDTTVDGPSCVGGDLAITPGSLDGTTDYAWGYAPFYSYTYEDTVLTFERVVMIYVDGYSWFPFAFNLPSLGLYQVEGDATELTFSRGIKEPDGSYVAYHYQP